MSSVEPRMWAHSYVRCGRCGYDSLEVNEVHVYEEGRKALECPMCRSLDCRPIDVDGERGLEPEAATIEFPAPEGMMVLDAMAVFDCANDEGESVVFVDGGGMRKTQVLGLLTYGIHMVHEEASRENREGDR